MNVIESQISNTLDESRWAATFDMLNIVFTALFTAELCMNLFVNWFNPFIVNGLGHTPHPATAHPTITLSCRTHPAATRRMIFYGGAESVIASNNH